MEEFKKPVFLNFKPDYKPYKSVGFAQENTVWTCHICYANGIRDRVNHNLTFHGTLYPRAFDPLGVMWDIVNSLWGENND
jgi:hypothetical protein